MRTKNAANCAVRSLILGMLYAGQRSAQSIRERSGRDLSYDSTQLRVIESRLADLDASHVLRHRLLHDRSAPAGRDDGLGQLADSRVAAGDVEGHEAGEAGIAKAHD